MFFFDPADKQKNDVHRSQSFSNETADRQHRANEDAHATFLHLHFSRMISDRDRCTSIAHSCITLQERACLRFARARARARVHSDLCTDMRTLSRVCPIRPSADRLTAVSAWDENIKLGYDYRGSIRKHSPAHVADIRSRAWARETLSLSNQVSCNKALSRLMKPGVN